MRKYSKIIAVLVLGLMFLSGCSSTAEGPQNKPAGSASDRPGTITIAASFYPVYIFTLNITQGIEGVKVVDMTQPTAGCLHDYAVTPEDMKNLEDAQVLVINGADMESFMGKVIKQFPDLKTIDSSQGIKLIKASGDQGPNPHIWASISNAITQVQNIGEQLAVVDPAHAAQYKTNTQTYVRKLEAQRSKMHAALDGLKNRNIITFHEAFPYFAQEFNLNIVGIIEREPGSEPSARELDQTIDKIEALKVKALFAEPQYSAQAAETIAHETGCQVYTLDPAVTGPMTADAYINIMDKNLHTLEEALQ
jgi:zinc transport system substrate-binding protein